MISLSKIDENNLKTLDLYYNGQGDRLSEEIWALGALDYMPITIYDQLQTREKSILVNDGQRILNYKQDYNLLTFEDERESLVEYVLPLIYYKGYKVVEIFDDKEKQNQAFELLLQLFNQERMSQELLKTFQAIKMWKSNVRFESSLTFLVL